MLAFRNSPSEISLVLGASDAKWLSDEMSFVAELYRSKTSSSECQFGGDNNVAAASFWETALKCQRLSIALQQAVSRGQRWEDDGRDHSGFHRHAVEYFGPHYAAFPTVALRRIKSIRAET
jgi:hypothetical protein